MAKVVTAFDQRCIPAETALLLGHILPVCFLRASCPGGRSPGLAAAWDFHYGLSTFRILLEGQTADDPEATGERYRYRILQKTIEADPALGPVSQKDAGPSSSVTTRLRDRARQIIL